MTDLTKVASSISDSRQETLETTGNRPDGPGRPAERPVTPRAPRRYTVPWRRLPLLAVLPASVLLWLLSLRHVQLDRMGGYGLIPILPILFWVALGLLTLGFAATLTRPWVRTSWLLGYVLALIGVLHATPTLLEGTLRYAWAWKHIAVVDYLQRHGGTDGPASELGAYHQWPGFFSLNAELVQLGGLKTALAYAAWAPVINNLMMIAPLVLILRTMTRDRRVLWASIWIFYSCAWTGQDYFSPQAFAFTLFLVIIGIVLNRAAAAREREPEQSRRPRDGTAAWVLLLLPLVAAVDSSHQLTPLILILALALLAAFRYRTPVLLWTLGAATALMLAWDSTVARPYIRDNLTSIIKSFGSLDANATAPLNGAATASHEQQVIAYVDTAAALLVALLAIVAVILHRRLRRSSALLLILAPLPMLAANDYGGEIIFRVYLFALPAAAFLNREALLPTRHTRRVHAVVFPAFLLLLLAAFVTPYYGKEAQNYFPPNEITATDHLYRIAPHGSTIVAASSDYPGGETDYEYYSQTSWLNNLTGPQLALVERDPQDALEDQLSGHNGPAYFILTTSQIAEIRTAGLLPPDALDRLEQVATTSPEFTVVYRNADAVIITLAPQPAPAASHTPNQPGGTP